MSVVAGQQERATNIRQHFIGNGMGYSDCVCVHGSIFCFVLEEKGVLGGWSSMRG